MNAKIPGVAGELAAEETELPNGLKIQRRVPSDSTTSSTDYELATRDGGIAELEVKGHTPDSWKSMLDEYEQMLKAPDPHPGAGADQIGRLLKQVEAGHARGRRVYVAISDGTPMVQRTRLLKILERADVAAEELITLPEDAIKRIGKRLRKHLGIQQPGGKRAGATEVTGND